MAEAQRVPLPADFNAQALSRDSLAVDRQVPRAKSAWVVARNRKLLHSHRLHAANPQMSAGVHVRVEFCEAPPSDTRFDVRQIDYGIVCFRRWCEEEFCPDVRLDRAVQFLKMDKVFPFPLLGLSMTSILRWRKWWD